MKRLLLIPLLGGLVIAAGMMMKDPAVYYRVVLLVASFFTAASSFATMRRFSPGDKLFTGWLFLGVGYGISAVRHLERLYEIVNGTELLGRMADDSMLVLQNLSIAVALFLFVGSWRATGLAVPVSRATAVLSTLGGIAVAIVVGGYPLMQGLATAGSESVLLVSTLGDMVGIALIAPLAMSALALRGGLLMHTWMYLAAGETFWLVYDIWLSVRQAARFSPRVGVGVEEIVRMAAIMFTLASTVAQRRATRPVRPTQPSGTASAAI